MQDLRYEPEVMDINLLNLQRPSNSSDFSQWATSPPVNEMCLWHPLLPWHIIVTAEDSTGVTIKDILVQMYDELHEALTSNQLHNNILTADDREIVWTAYGRRTVGWPELAKRGYMRIDFLGDDIIFLGLTNSKNGMWKIRTSKHVY